jgi:hypothetical protein
MESNLFHQGERELLNRHPVAFLCSRRCPPSVVTRSYDWAIEQRNRGNCVMTGNHSQIEKDVLHYLLKGNQPIIIALARGMKLRFTSEFQVQIDKGRLLFITSFASSVIRVTQETANKRNELMVELSSEVFAGYAQPGGNVEQLLLRWISRGKRVITFDVEENKNLISAGAEAV